MTSARLRVASPGTTPGPTADVHPQWTEVLSVLATGGRPLDATVRAELEPRFGVDFGRVRVHTGDRARSAAGSIGAVGFTLGRHVVLGAPATGAAGRDLLAHELAHVALQHPVGSTVDPLPTVLSQPHEAGEVAAQRAAHAALAGRPAGLTAPPRPAGTVFRQVPAHDRGAAGELGAAFVGYPRRDWVLVEGPGGPAGHGVTSRGFDLVAVRVRGDFEVHLVDNKSFARTSNVRSATALTNNLRFNLDALIAKVNTPRFNDFPRIVLLRGRLARARAALNTPGAPLPPGVQLIVTNEGGRSPGITAGLAARGVVFRDLNQLPPPTTTPPAQAPPTQPPPTQPPPTQPPPGPAGPGAAGPGAAGPGPAGPGVAGASAARPARPDVSSLARPLAQHLNEQQRFARRVLTLTRVLRATGVVLQVVSQLELIALAVSMTQNALRGRAFVLADELDRAERLAEDAATVRKEYADYSAQLAEWKWHLLRLFSPDRDQMLLLLVDSHNLRAELDRLHDELGTRIGALTRLEGLAERRERAARALVESGLTGAGAPAAAAFGAHVDLGRIAGALTRAVGALTTARDTVDVDRTFFVRYIAAARQRVAEIEQEAAAPSP